MTDNMRIFYQPQLPTEIWSIIVDFRTTLMLEQFVDKSTDKNYNFVDIIKILSKNIHKTSNIAVILYYEYIDIFINRYSANSLNMTTIHEKLVSAQDYLHNYDPIEKDFMKPFPTLKVDLYGTFFRKLFIKDGYFNIKSIISYEYNIFRYIECKKTVEKYLCGPKNRYYTFGGLNELKEYYNDEQMRKSISCSFTYLAYEYENTPSYYAYKHIVMFLLKYIQEIYPVPLSEYLNLEAIYERFGIENFGE